MADVMQKWRANMTDEERWRWHARVYAWRVFTGHAAIEERTSPVDAEGKWYDRGLIDEALKVYRERDWALARRTADEWAIARGFRNMAAWETETAETAAVRTDNGQWFRFKGKARPELGMPTVMRRLSAAAALGVKAREYTPAEFGGGAAGD